MIAVRPALEMVTDLVIETVLETLINSCVSQVKEKQTLEKETAF